MYTYVGQITSKDGNGKSHWQGVGGESGMWGGNVGEVVVFNDFRGIYMAFNKELWLGLGGELNTNSALEIIGGVNTNSQIGSAPASLGGVSVDVRVQNLQNEIATLKEENEALKAGASAADSGVQNIELQTQIADLQKQLAQVKASDITLLRQQITTLEAQLTEKTRIAEELRVELEALKKEGVRSDEDVTQVI